MTGIPISSTSQPRFKGNYKRIDNISAGGTTIEDPTQIRRAAVDFYSSLHSSSSPIIDDSLFTIKGPAISDEQNAFLIAVPLDSEIKQAIFQLKKSSSPSADGYTGAFFTSSWSIIGKDVTLAIKHFFTTGQLLRSWNTYFLSSTTFADFHPISLLNFSSKIITKILATMLSSIIPHLISQNQAAFIKGRSIHQHSTLAHEPFQKLNA